MRLTEEQYADLLRKRSAGLPDRRVAGDQGSVGMQTPADPESAPEGRNCVVLPWPPSDLNPNARPHWGTKRRAAKSYRAACRAHAVRVGLVAPDGPVHLWLDFYPPNRIRRDADNVVASMKSGLDGLADALGVNDSRFVLHPVMRDEIGGMVKVAVTAGPR